VQALAGENVTVTGWVPAIEPYLRRARVSIAPLRFGAGVKGKIAEAIAAGLPVVTTSIGAEGMELSDGDHALIADDPEAFAQAVVRLCTDDALWCRIATQAPAHLDAVMGAGVARAGIRQALAAVAPARSQVSTNAESFEDALAQRGPARPAPSVAVALHPAVDAGTLRRQLEALHTALAGERVDLVVIAGSLDAPSAEVLDGLPGGRVLRCTNHRGRARFHELAREATRAPVLVTVGPLALAQPGFLAPLVRAVADGAVFAGPAIDGAHGFRVAEDGSLWPREWTSELPVGALALDCLAATRETWAQAPLGASPREGHPEHQLAAWALERGSLVACADAEVQRLDAGPVSVIICTRNRAEELPDAIALLVACGATRGGSEVIIVDNASSDGTAEVAAELCANHPGVRVVREERPGLSHARNAGARVAVNQQLCYLDDDARPAPGWRESLAWALRVEGVAAAGGPVCGLWPAAREAGWPPPGLEGSLSVLDAGDVVRAMNPPEIVYGANWAIRRDALAATGGFDAHLGYSPDVKIGGEEVAIAWRLYLRRIGATLYVPGAAVGHRIDEDRIRDSYVVERFFKVGIEHAHLRADREGMGRQRVLGDAQTAAADLLGVLRLTGELSLEDALARIQAAALPLPERVTAAEALGLLSASVLLLGEAEVELDDLRLILRPENLRGVLASAAAAA
jgi:GT2 family glycosyltransferase